MINIMSINAKNILILVFIFSCSLIGIAQKKSNQILATGESFTSCGFDPKIDKEIEIIYE